MNRRKKIVLAGAFDFPEGGAAARCVHMLAKGFVGEGQDVTVYSTTGSWGVSSSTKIDGFQATAVSRKKQQSNGLYKTLAMMKARVLLCLILLKLTVRKEYKLLIFYGPVIMFPIVALCAIIVNQKTAYLMADSQPKAPRLPFKHKLIFAIRNGVDFLLARYSSTIIVLGTSVLENHYSYIAPKTKQIRIWAPTDTKLFHAGNGEYAMQRYEITNNRIVCYAGALDTLEGVHILISAFKSLVTRYPNAVLVLAGKEPDIDRVTGEKVDLGVGENEENCNIVFTGQLSLKEIIDLYAASDILVMPKIDHPLNHVASPIKIAEYLASGRAVISSDICELNSILGHLDDTFLCSPGDVEALSNAIEMIFNDQGLKRKLEKNAMKAAWKYFDCNISAKYILTECTDIQLGELKS